MHLFILLFLILYAGWTVSAHLCVLLGLTLHTLLLMAPVVTACLFGAYYVLVKTTRPFLHTPSAIQTGMRLGSHTVFTYSVVLLIILPVALYLSWLLFWVLAVVILILSLLRGDEGAVSVIDNGTTDIKNRDYVMIAVLALAAIGLTYAVSRSDLDDASYVAIAAFSAAHPTHALLSTDPMLGEPAFPLVISNLRFASFELISGAIAYVLSIPAMDVYYIYLLPVWVCAMVASMFLLTKELIPRHWLLAGVVALLLTVLLGEMHRSPANFAFVRIFQGKAVFLSVIVPTIFYLTARLFSARGTKADVLLLACCQVAAVGLSSFGMLIGPIAGFGALLSHIPLAINGHRNKFYYACATLCIPLPYLMYIALTFNNTLITKFSVETAANVWISVFGAHQQYLVGFLLLAGPVLAKETLTRWRMAVPALLLYAVYLNPWLAEFISKYVTSPATYWRVVWSFPILIYAAVSLCMIVRGLFERTHARWVSVVLSLGALYMALYAFPFHTLRPSNIDGFAGFATWKIPSAHLIVAQKAIEIDADGGRLLAPDEIAGVISRFEVHPRLISTRGMYVELFRPLIAHAEFAPRQLLYDVVMGTGTLQPEKVRSAIRMLDVSVIVFRSETETNDVVRLLESEGFTQHASINGYTIWAR